MKQIDQILSNHFWIIFGPLDIIFTEWPYLLVDANFATLRCHFAKIVKSTSGFPCSNEPISTNEEKIISSTVSFKPQVYNETGKMDGIYVDVYSVLSEYVHFKPTYIQNGFSFIDVTKTVSDGNADFGVPMGMAHNRYLKVDFTKIIIMSELTWSVPRPKQISSFYQFIYPFQFSVWLMILTISIVFSIIMYLLSLLTKHKNCKENTGWGHETFTQL